MALIKCPECGRENVSDSAEMCPNCGYGIRAHFEKIRQEEDIKRKEEEKRKQKEITESKDNMPTKEIKIMAIVGIIIMVFIVGIIVFSNISKTNQEIEKYCSLGSFEISQYNNEQECMMALIDCADLYNDMKTEIISEWRYKDDNKKTNLCNHLEDNFDKVIEQIVNNYAGEMEYSLSEIKRTLKEEGGLLGSIGERYDEQSYGYAFDAYLYYFTDVYVEDCIYYIVKTAYPEIFSEGISERLLGVGKDAWGDTGQELLDKLLVYIDSTPEGRSAYTSKISTAKQQLYDKNETTGKTINGKKPPAIGMTAEEVKASTWGSPKEINKDTYSWGVKEQWVYSGYRYIYLEDGIVTSISE